MRSIPLLLLLSLLGSGSPAVAAPPQLPSDIRDRYPEVTASLARIGARFVEIERLGHRLDVLRREGRDRPGDHLGFADAYDRAAEHLAEPGPALRAVLDVPGRLEPYAAKGSLHNAYFYAGESDALAAELFSSRAHRSTVRAQLAHPAEDVREAAAREARRQGRVAARAFGALRRFFRSSIQGIIHVEDGTLREPAP